MGLCYSIVIAASATRIFVSSWFKEKSRMARGSLGIASLLCVLVQTAWTGVTNDTVSMPTFCPPNSTTFAVVQRLSLSSATPYASIYYTLDGTLPTVGNASLFNAASPISLSTTTTVKAVASAPGYNLSDVAEVTYVVTGGTLASRIAAPVFSKNGGNSKIHDKIPISAFAAKAGHRYSDIRSATFAVG